VLPGLTDDEKVLATGWGFVLLAAVAMLAAVAAKAGIETSLPPGVLYIVGLLLMAIGAMMAGVVKPSHLRPIGVISGLSSLSGRQPCFPEEVPCLTVKYSLG